MSTRSASRAEHPITRRIQEREQRATEDTAALVVQSVRHAMAFTGAFLIFDNGGIPQTPLFFTNLGSFERRLP